MARARCRALLTAGTVVPSWVATSAALNSSTSRSTSTARCRGGSTCIAATSASRSPVRTPGSNRASGNGCSQGMSNEGVSGAAGSRLGAPSPDGSGRRARPVSAVRQALVAIRYSQVRTEARLGS